MTLWMITGAGRGLGRAFAAAALERGDRVVATIRQDGVLDDLAKEYGDRLAVRRLDVSSATEVSAVVAEVVETVGTPDVVVNNAGYGLVGAVEELSEAELRAQFDVNFFGAVWVTQAVLPHLRARGSGRIVQVSTVGAVGHLPLFGAYNASKWALEGLSSALAAEVAPLGLGVHLLQLGGFATDWAGGSMRFATAGPAYDGTREAILGAPSYPELLVEPGASTDESPAVAAQALLALVDDADAPLRKVVGAGAHDMVRMALEWRRDDYQRDPEFTWPPAS
ncbi:SDR family NAD(P)-dependent oxidoreductase [Kribbella sandramycini]|uniref:NAD(P)-dependent dehydrogenase (Short-subunit alcohol dehydrogenase family) n=1 Tax=Kribbella sandramycini TaxID=60450 RepID=A0A7Y4KX73_9ACTN|nr:SDR family NAD(P)-dependent oxidoreductase [Kribbella sandramycini]MBB6569855.1 NAD(P)-dependent dehydrogenase (short-subunit alcohol dehydrogenase family) [Kribbella sandramycini]NOL40320.1 SDR family NAD(P)-dependent oxidoreductase [Kribbella sandramycini]